MGWVRREAVVLVVPFLLALATVPTVVVADSVTGQLIRGLNERLLYIAVPIAVLVEVILVYAVWRFHGNDDPKPTRDNRQLEITWTVATALVLLFVGTASFHVLAHPLVSTTPDTASIGQQPGNVPQDAVEIRITTVQWNYTFSHPEANVSSDETLVLPADRTLYIYVTSNDVIHSVHVPELGLKQDAFPGQHHLIRTRITEPGEYRMYCAEFCGVGHPEMIATVRVVNDSAYESWLEDRRNEAGTGDERTVTTESNATDHQ